MTKLKRLVADLSLDKVMLQDVIPTNVLKPVQQHDVMRYLMGRYDVSQRRACRVVQATRSLVYYRSRKDPLTRSATTTPLVVRGWVLAIFGLLYVIHNRCLLGMLDSFRRNSPLRI